MMRPDVGGRSPPRQLNIVDLPAPFGPISPTISPSPTLIDASETARKPPNCFVTALASSSMTALLAGRNAVGKDAAEAMHEIENAARLKSRDEQNRAAIEDVSQTRALAAEIRVRDGLQWGQDERAKHRAEQRAGPAERGDDDHLHGHENAEPAFRIDKAGLDRIERSRRRRESGTQHQRQKLAAAHGNAEAARRALAGTQRTQVKAEPATLQPPRCCENDREQRQEQIVIWKPAPEGQIPYAAPDGGALQADRRTKRFCRRDEKADKLSDRNRRHAEIVPLQAERRDPDENGKDEAHNNAEGKPGDRRPFPELVDEQRQIGAGAEEHRVTDGDLAGIAADNVPRGSRCGGEQQRRADVDIKRAGQHKRIDNRA